MQSTSAKPVQTVPMLDLGAQYQSIKSEIDAAIGGVLQSQHFILGPNVAALEKEVAEFCGIQFGIGVASGTDALVLALRAAGIGPGDEVLAPTFTFIATADAVSALGATPVFVDIDPTNFCIDPAKLEEKITDKTKAVIPVHLYGHAADMDAIRKIATKHSLIIIEDNAQAIGATYKGKRTGSMGQIGCLSFFPSKNLGGFGDGGMIVTDSTEVSSRLRSLRAHGATKKYFSSEQGWNSRLDELQAAILRVKLRYLQNWNDGRRSRAALYNALLGRVEGITVPQTADGCEHVFHQYTVRVANRDGVQKKLTEKGIGSMVYYPVPIHLQPIYSHLPYKLGDLPESEAAAKEVLSLPIYAELTDAQVQYVAEALIEAVRQG